MALGGLPLAHEQAAAYCERLEISLAEYARRFAADPVRLLDTDRDAPVEYRDKTTVAITFALAIEATAKLHPAAEPLIVHAALLAPEPIPLFLFAEGREKFGEPLSSLLIGDGLGEAVAALRALALVDREPIPDERDPAVKTDTIRLHRLVREVAVARRAGEAREDARGALIHPPPPWRARRHRAHRYRRADHGEAHEISPIWPGSKVSRHWIAADGRGQRSLRPDSREMQAALLDRLHCAPHCCGCWPTL